MSRRYSLGGVYGILLTMIGVGATAKPFIIAFLGMLR